MLLICGVVVGAVIVVVAVDVDVVVVVSALISLAPGSVETYVVTREIPIEH